MAESVDHNQLHGLQPVHCVRNIEASVAYYRDVLGFEVDFVFGHPPVHARVSSGDRMGGSAVRIRFSLATDKEARPDAGYSYIHVGCDLDELYEEYLKRGVVMLGSPQNRAWGLRDFYARDCDGFVFCFATETPTQGR